MIALDSLRIGGMLLIDEQGQVMQADPVVLMPLDMVLDLYARGALTIQTRGTVRFCDQVSYQPVGWTAGALVLQRVEDAWIAPDVIAAAVAATEARFTEMAVEVAREAVTADRAVIAEQLAAQGITVQFEPWTEPAPAEPEPVSAGS